MTTDDKKPTVEADDFIQRWSRRKAEAAAGSDEQEQPVAPTDPVEDAEQEATAPPEILTDADMPPLESLDQDADVSSFLSPGVSDDLRRAALRKVFRSAKFNVCDGLDDYCGDYTKFEPLGDVITADMRFRMARALERLAETDETAEGTEEDGGEETRPTVLVARTDENTDASANDSSVTDMGDDEHEV